MLPATGYKLPATAYQLPASDMPPQDDDAAVVTSKKGPVRITAGRRDEKSLGVRNAPQQIKLRVASLTHLSEGCVERR